MAKSRALVKEETVQDRILLVRGQRVIIDADLAEFYRVPTKRLNEQVKRNKDRFPDDFIIQLTSAEKQEVVAQCDHLSKLKFSKSLPYAFNEHGAVMAASVLNSKRAVGFSVFVVRAFVGLRQVLSENKEIGRKIAQLERRLTDHDEQIIQLLQAIRKLVQKAPVPKRRRIGPISDV